MKIVFVYGHMFNAHTWSQVCVMLRGSGIAGFFSQLQTAEKPRPLWKRIATTGKVTKWVFDEENQEP